MNPLENIARQKANDIMSMNRHARRAFAKKNRLPIAIAGSNVPYSTIKYEVPKGASRV